MSKTKLLAVTGNPVFHSRSPQLFNRVFQETGLGAIYIRLEARGAKDIINTAKAMNLSGLNVTSPFKEDVIRFLDRIDEHALKINAVNCVIAQKNKYIGYNTDFIGVRETFNKNGINPKSKIIVILGAGGSARAAAYALILSEAKKVIILGRNREKVKKVSLQLGCEYAPLEKAEEALKQTEIFISCIPSPEPIINPSFFRPGLVIMDANYKDSYYSRDSRFEHCRIISGLEWLLSQALPSFELFTGQKVPIALQKELWNDLQMKKAIDKPNIALIGFMGSGKTTVGEIVAEKMGLHFMDTDKQIEVSSGMTIPEIFKKKGERCFRDIEKSVIRKQIIGSEAKVFSLGGGAVLDEENLKILSQYCRVIWLWVSVPVAIERIDAGTRPLLVRSNPQKSAEKIFQARIPYYARCSDLVINTETGNAHEIAGRIKDEMD